MKVPATPPSTYRSAAAVVTIVFFMLGFITCLNDILIPHLRNAFSLNYAQAMLVQSTFFGTYFLISLPAGKIVTRMGYQKALAIGLLIAAVGATLFYPAAGMQSYAMFLLALFVLASGVTVLQVAFNPYMALLGPEETASSRMSLAHAFNSLGTTVAPAFGGLLILSSQMLTPELEAGMTAQALALYRSTEAHAVQLPYLGLACTLVAVAALVYFWPLPDFRSQQTSAHRVARGLFEPLRYRHLRLAVLGIFFYVGAEVSIGSFMINYLAHPDVGATTHSRAAFLLSLYWGGAMVGRFLGAWVLRRIPAGAVLAACAAGAGGLVLASMLSTGNTAVWTIIAVGLMNSIMFPTIFSLGIVGLRDMTPQASSLISMAIVGGAIMPLLQGLMADRIGIQAAYFVPVLCYVYIAFYGAIGSRPQRAG